MRRDHHRGRAVTALLAAGLLVWPAAASAGQGGPPQGPPPPVASSGGQVKLVAAGLQVPAQIAIAYGRVFVATPGNEETGKGAGLYSIWRGKVTRIDRTPAFGVAIAPGGTLYTTNFNKITAWTGFRNGAFRSHKVVFSRPASELPYLETMAVGPDGRLYMGTGDAGDDGPIGAALSGRVLAVARDGSAFEELAKGLRQPFSIGFVDGDPIPWVGNESDESKPTPGDFIVHAASGSDFGWPACQWLDPAAAACQGKTAPSIRFGPHSSPTGMVGHGGTLYVAFFGGTTKAGPEIRAIKPDGSSRRVVQSAVPLVGTGISGGWLYFGDVAGSVYRVKL